MWRKKNYLKRKFMKAHEEVEKKKNSACTRDVHERKLGEDERRQM